MKYIISILILAGLIVSPKSIHEYFLMSNDSQEKDSEYLFPKDWLGHWEGDLDIHNTKGILQTIPMALNLSETEDSNVYTWAIIYGLDTIAGLRDYQLIQIDSPNVHYQINEQNGIVLDATLIDNELISVFEVMGNTITTTYRREEEFLYFEILMYQSEASYVTGDTIIGSDTIPSVINYIPKVRQKARLRRK